MITLVRVGTPDRHAAPEDFDDLRQKFVKAKKENIRYIVTHHAVSILQLIPVDDEIVVFHVGTADIPATEDDIIDLQTELETAEREDRPVVTHHLVDVSIIRL